MRPSLRPVLAALALLAATATALSAADAPARKKILILTGDDTKSHDWLTCAAATREILVESGRYEVSVTGNPAILEDPKRFADVAVIYLLMANAQTPTLSDSAKANLLAYVRSGHGFVTQHYATSSFKEWPEFRELCGRVWVSRTSGHGPRGTFAAQIADRTHAITQGLQDFTADDELYAKLQGDAPIHVLVSANSDWSKRVEPLAFTLTFGAGRVFNHTFGHDVKALSNPAVRTLILRGTAWAAGDLK